VSAEKLNFATELKVNHQVETIGEGILKFGPVKEEATLQKLIIPIVRPIVLSSVLRF